MYPYPNETVDSYRARWREGCMPLRHEVRMGTTANHKLGDISRDEPDYFWVETEDADDYIGSWVTGFGFFNVHFPKDTTREPTDEEWEWFLDNPVSM